MAESGEERTHLITGAGAQNEDPEVQTSGFRQRVKDYCNCASSDRLLAITIALILFSISLALTISYYQTASYHPERFPHYIVLGCIMAYEAVATVCLLLMFGASTRPADDGVTDADLKKWQQRIRRNIKLFGIVPFVFAIATFDFLRLLARWNCDDASNACSNWVIRWDHLVDQGYPITRTVYLFIEMFFCFNFNAKNVVQLKKLLVALAFVQATNLFIFMDAIVDESVVFSAGRNWTYEMSLCFNETVNVSEHFVKCFSRTTGQYDILQSASPYLYPFIMEYLMLVIECVFHWFLNNADRAENGQPAVSTTNDENATGTTYGSINTEEQPHREANGASTSDVIQSTSVTCFCYMYNHFVACCKGYPGLFITVAVFILFSLGFVILGVYNLVLGNIDYLNAFMIYRLVYWVVLTALAVVGQCVLFCFFSSEQRNLNGFEYLVIMSCIGPIVQSILTIVADVQTEGLLLPLNMFLAEAIFNIIQICTQLAFFGHIRSMKTHENTENNKISCLILMGIIWCFVVSNFALWAEDSFIETRSSVTSWQKQYFDKWPLIYNIFNPLALMFRFNSALLFLNILFDKRLLQ